VVCFLEHAREISLLHMLCYLQLEPLVDKEIDLDAGDNDGRIALHIAVRIGSEKLVQLLSDVSPRRKR
jgi:ankyrin repeat protein